MRPLRSDPWFQAFAILAVVSAGVTAMNFLPGLGGAGKAPRDQACGAAVKCGVTTVGLRGSCRSLHAASDSRQARAARQARVRWLIWVPFACSY